MNALPSRSTQVPPGACTIFIKSRIEPCRIQCHPVCFSQMRQRVLGPVMGTGRTWQAQTQSLLAVSFTTLCQSVQGYAGALHDAFLMSSMSWACGNGCTVSMLQTEMHCHNKVLSILSAQEHKTCPLAIQAWHCYRLSPLLMILQHIYSCIALWLACDLLAADKRISDRQQQAAELRSEVASGIGNI